MRTRGITLGTTLLVLALIVTLAFAVSSVMTANLQLTRAGQNRQTALNLAESALALATEQILARPDFGTNPGSPMTRVTLDSAPGGEGVLSFTPSEVPRHSLNNLTNPNGESVQGRVVPPFTAYLVAEGRYNGVVERVECMLRVPALPALACEGQLNSSGSLMVAAVETIDEVLPLVQDPNSPHLPATLASNEGSAQAIVLGTDTRVSGDVQAVGGIQLLSAATTVIDGSLLAYSQEVPLPDVTLLDYDPVVMGGAYVDLDWEPEVNPTFNGRVRRSGDLNVTGDLNLESCLLYVDGDLTVSGGVTGRGAVVTTGDLFVNQAANLDNNHHLGLLAGGDLSLGGANRQSSYIQGIVYCQGDFSARGVTIVGVTVVKGNGQVNLQDCNLVYLPGNDSVEVVEPLTFKITAQGRGTIDLLDEAFLFDFSMEPAPPGTQVVRPNRTVVPASYLVTITMSNGVRLQTPAAGPQDIAAQTHFALMPHLGSIAESAFQLEFNTGTQAPVEINMAAFLFEWLAWTNSMMGSNPVVPSWLRAIWDTAVSEYDNIGGLITVMEFDPSKFLRWEDRVRVALWRVVP